MIPTERKLSHLTLHFLGAPKVRVGDNVCAFPTRKALALLVYLTVEGGIHLREKLITLFWPDSDSNQGRASLRTTLQYIRNTLGDAAVHLVSDHDTVTFDLPPDLDFDFQTLQSCSQLARQPQSSHLPELISAAVLLRGEFLEGFSLSDAPEFDDWARLAQESSHRAGTHVLDALSQLQSEGGELQQAIETAARWVGYDPLDEAARRRLMQLHFTDGDRAAALHTFDSYRARLERELGAAPAPETVSLAERIRTQPPPVRQEGVGTESARGNSDAPLIGRADEHRQLVATYRAARAGQPQLFLLEGEPGIGKSRLAREFLAWVSAQGGSVLQGRAFEMGSQVPYQVIVDTLRNCKRITSDSSGSGSPGDKKTFGNGITAPTCQSRRHSWRQPRIMALS